MNDRTDSTVTPTVADSLVARALRVVGYLGADMTIALVWVVLIVAIVLFSGVVSQFAYVDF